MIISRSVSGSKSKSEIHSKETPYEIFTTDELVAMKNQITDSDLVEAIEHVIPRINQGMHNKGMGWYIQIKNRITQLKESKGTTRTLNEIMVGAEIYLVAANRLQAPPTGRELHYGKNGDKSKTVNVYEGFWHDCIGAIYFAFIANIAEVYHLKKSYHRNKKIDIYTLLKIKNMLFLHFNEVELVKIKNKIDEVLKLIYSTKKIPTTFILSQEEANEAHSILLDIEHKHQTVAQLRKLLESTPYVVRYIHIRPIILIQFAQALDYLYKLMAAANKNHPGLKIIDNKRKEISAVMLFQEKLLMEFGYDDFIEALHMNVGNYYTKIFKEIAEFPGQKNLEEKTFDALNSRLTNAYLSVLPTQCFFDYEKSQFIEIFKYADEDPNIPKPVPYSGISDWRKKYLKETKLEAKEPLKELKTIPASLEINETGLNLTRVQVIKRLEPIEIKMPTVILTSLSYLQEKTHNIFDTNAFNFFISIDRIFFYEKIKLYFKEHKEKIDCLLNQIERKATHHELFESDDKPGEKISFFRGHKVHDFSHEGKINFTALSSGIAIFSEVLSEMQAAQEMMKQSDEHNAFIFMKYFHYIGGLYAAFQENLQKIITYWHNYMAINTFTKDEHQELVMLQDLLNGLNDIENFPTRKPAPRLE